MVSGSARLIFYPIVKFVIIYPEKMPLAQFKVKHENGLDVIQNTCLEYRQLSRNGNKTEI